MSKINPVNLIKALTLYPGSGEYVYEIDPVEVYGAKINMMMDGEKTNVVVSIDQLRAAMPNLQYISVVVDWFATSLNAGESRVIPKPENNDSPIEWQVGNYNRNSAEPMHSFDNGEITFGGTPTDKSIVKLCSHLKSLGYKVMLMPMLMVDDDSLSKPWRGFITAKGKKSNWEKDINHFFQGEEGYNKFILHYANLEFEGIKLRDVIDSFVIGSELKELTATRVNQYLSPAIQNLKSLACSVKSIVGENVKLTYSANWGEYSLPHMDKLWCDPNIDFVGISAYFPLTPDLEQKDITFYSIKNGWTSGEGYNYYIDNGIKVNYNDPSWAWKNVKHWWESFHPTKTCWLPKLKPIIFTEYGFSSIEGASNKPYYYFDASSDDTAPTASNYAQSLAIAASETFFQEMNKQEPDFLPYTFLYAWDARPFPAFPENCNYWSDCIQYPYSHSVNGKLQIVETGSSEHEL